MAFLKICLALLFVFALTQNIDSTITTPATATAKATPTPTTTKNPHPGPQDPKCLQSKEPGPCHMNLMRYYYNPETNACEEFKFGGCKGNENKFGFKETCEKACKKFTDTSSSSAKAPVTNEVHKAQPSTHKSEALHATATEKSTSATTTTKAIPSTTASSKSKSH
uniref:BPTI/Kunitz inhibitor domain-containing protein n=1 Tax=Glossina brevipalpis TaxID=37001 RepID=A0A1A9WUS2_9MUSC